MSDTPLPPSLPLPRTPSLFTDRSGKELQKGRRTQRRTISFWSTPSHLGRVLTSTPQSDLHRSLNPSQHSYEKHRRSKLKFLDIGEPKVTVRTVPSSGTILIRKESRPLPQQREYPDGGPKESNGGLLRHSGWGGLEGGTAGRVRTEFPRLNDTTYLTDR